MHMERDAEKGVCDVNHRTPRFFILDDITSITVTMSGTTGAIGSSNALCNPNQFRVWVPKVLHTVQVELLNGEIVYRYLLAFESSTMKTVAPFYYQGL